MNLQFGFLHSSIEVIQCHLALKLIFILPVSKKHYWKNNPIIHASQTSSYHFYSGSPFQLQRKWSVWRPLWGGHFISLNSKGRTLIFPRRVSLDVYRYVVTSDFPLTDPQNTWWGGRKTWKLINWHAAVTLVHSSLTCTERGKLLFNILHRLHLSVSKLTERPDLGSTCVRCGGDPASLGHM